MEVIIDLPPDQLLYLVPQGLFYARADVLDGTVNTQNGNSVTISMGVAQLTDDIPDLGTLIDRANQAEHKAKEKGDGSLLVFAEGLIGGLSKLSSRRRVPTRSASFRAEGSAEAARG